MEILLTREKGLLFSGTNPTGARIAIGRPGDYPEATSPMEMVLEALAGCSSIDILMILEKQKATVTRYQVKTEGQRDPAAQVSPFTRIVLDYIVDTDAPAAKVARAVRLAVEKYCSVAKMLEQSVDIRYTLTVNGRKTDPVRQE